MIHSSFNPIDVVIDAMHAQEMPVQQLSSHEVMTELQGHWGFYKMQFFWQDDIQVLHLNVIFELPINTTDKLKIYHLMALLNERLIIGHFEIFPEENLPAFRYSLMTPTSNALSIELLEEIIDITLDECESCFPAFKSLIEDQQDPEQAALIAVMDTVGEA